MAKKNVMPSAAKHLARFVAAALLLLQARCFAALGMTLS
jgi:hypothetical protein